MRLEGSMTALATPMRDGGVDFDALTKLIENQIAAGIEVLVAVGTTGESAALTVREHVAVVKHTVQVAAGRVPVVAGAGANSTAEAIDLSKASVDAGAQALLHVTPYYNKPTQEGLFRHFAAVAEATDLPVILYNVPGRTGCDLQPVTVDRLAEIDTIAAIKEATADMRRASDVIARVGTRISVLSGDDFTAFTLMALGGKGVISVVGNVVPGRVAKMCSAAAAGDWDTAREMHYATVPLAKLLFIESNPIPVKAALELLGVFGPEIRLPLVPCSPQLRDRIQTQLEAEGLL